MKNNTEKNNFWFWIIPAALLVFVLNIAGHFLYVIFYSHVINPGQQFVRYQQHAITSAPYTSFLIGFPVMIFAGWWIGKKAPAKFSIVAGLLVAFVYLLIDVTILILIGEFSKTPLLFAISYAPNFIAAYAGGSMSQTRQLKE